MFTFLLYLKTQIVLTIAKSTFEDVKKDINNNTQEKKVIPPCTPLLAQSFVLRHELN